MYTKRKLHFFRYMLMYLRPQTPQNQNVQTYVCKRIWKILMKRIPNRKIAFKYFFLIRIRKCFNQKTQRKKQPKCVDHTSLTFYCIVHFAFEPFNLPTPPPWVRTNGGPMCALHSKKTHGEQKHWSGGQSSYTTLRSLVTGRHSPESHTSFWHCTHVIHIRLCVVAQHVSNRAWDLQCHSSWCIWCTFWCA